MRGSNSEGNGVPVPIESTKIWDLADSIAAGDGMPAGEDLRGEIHPDLIRYKGWWYCGLKESPLRRMRLIRSRDGCDWQSVRIFKWAESGAVGDAKFSITADGALMITTWTKDVLPYPGQVGKGPTWTASVTWLSHDGVDWGHVHACPTGFATRSVVRYWTTWFRGAGYSVDCTSGNLYKTLDGKSWLMIVPDIFATWDSSGASKELLQAVDPNDVNQHGSSPPRRPNETALAFDPVDGTACAIARTHPFYAIVGTAKAPDYKDWSWQACRVDWDGDGKLVPAWQKLGVQMGGPWIGYLSNGVLLTAGRADASTPGKPKGRLTLFVLDRDAAILKRYGDFDGYSHYPGIVEHEGQLWITCGKQQKMDPFAVYLLKVPLP